MKIWRLALLTLIAAATTAFAHVGSPDVYLEGDAGPYRLLISVSPPPMIPGVAEVRISVASGVVSSLTVTPVYVNGKDQGLPPTPDLLQSSPGDPHWFSGKIWLMESGAWDLRVEVAGPQGIGKLAIPIPAYARRTLPMQRGLGSLLFGLMVLLAAGLVAIAGAAAREGVLPPAVTPSLRNIRLSRIAMVVAAGLVVTILALGNWWWNSQAADLKRTMLYNAPPLEVSLESGRLTLKMGEDFWHQTRKQEWSMSLVPDHGHLMHLFLLRSPSMDRFYHLHPEQVGQGLFAAKLPPIPSGTYKVFADIVRGTGFPETMVSEINLPEISGQPFSGDDSGAVASAFAPSDRPATVSTLPDGSRMIWEQEGTPLNTASLSWFRFRIVDLQGQPVAGLEPYMGMAGHAEFVRSDFSVFAHIHPMGSVPMASLMIAQQDAGLPMDHDSMNRGSDSLPFEVSFPYGFPQPGNYRLFVQIKRNGLVETGVFDAHVRN
jgi:hypothetical protein